jgi:hypothetical protein
MIDVDECDKRAEECRKLATIVSDPDDKAFWLRIAEDWLRVASVARQK